MRPRVPAAVAAALFVSISTSCRDVVPPPASMQGEGTASALSTTSHSKTLMLALAPSAKPVVGASVDATAEGLPPNRTVDLVWETVEGGWVVENGYRFKGKKFTETTKVLGRAQVDGRGQLATQFTIPEDFGGCTP